MRALAIVGNQNSGKTHLIERLIRHLRTQGLTVSTIKHTHHRRPDVDTPGKDSHRHAAAGAVEVLLASDHGWTLIRGSTEPAPLGKLIGELRSVDLVLVEGYKHLTELPRLEVYRGLTGALPLAARDPGIAAVACPAELDLALPGIPRVPLNDTAAVAALVLQLA